MSTIHLIGTGPSAKEYIYKTTAAWFLPDVVATVNGGINQIPFPNYYAVVENPAMLRYQKQLEDLDAAGKSCIFVRPQGIKFYSAHCGRMPGLVTINEHFGPGNLQWMNKDCQHKDSKETWISVGVFMLWMLAAIVKPEKIKIYGLDGYSRTECNYTKGCEAEHDHTHTPMFMRNMNRNMAQAIAAITGYYNYTTFVWNKKPFHAQDNWRVEYAR